MKVHIQEPGNKKKEMMLQIVNWTHKIAKERNRLRQTERTTVGKEN